MQPDEIRTFASDVGLSNAGLERDYPEVSGKDLRFLGLGETRKNLKHPKAS